MNNISYDKHSLEFTQDLILISNHFHQYFEKTNSNIVNLIIPFPRVEIDSNIIASVHRNIIFNSIDLEKEGISEKFRTRTSWAGPTGCHIENSRVIFLNHALIDSAMNIIVQDYNEFTFNINDWRNYNLENFFKFIIFYRNFIGIHPFTDGNGRTARGLLFNMKSNDLYQNKFEYYLSKTKGNHNMFLNQWFFENYFENFVKIFIKIHYLSMK